MGRGPTRFQPEAGVVADLLRHARESAQMTMAQAAAALGPKFHAASIHRYEEGHCTPRADVLWRLLAVYGRELVTRPVRYPA